jgi:hypothetical protein
MDRPPSISMDLFRSSKMNRFLLTCVFGFAALLSASNVCRAQSSYFYGYYYPDEHRFASSKLNMGIYTYSTVTPI